MSTISVELPDHLMLYVDQSAEQAGYASASEYIAALVAAASEKQGEIEQALLGAVQRNRGPTKNGRPSKVGWSQRA